jgi:hypothetical protein
LNLWLDFATGMVGRGGLTLYDHPSFPTLLSGGKRFFRRWNITHCILRSGWKTRGGARCVNLTARNRTASATVCNLQFGFLFKVQQSVAVKLAPEVSFP